MASESHGTAGQRSAADHPYGDLAQLIDGAWVDGGSGETFDVRNPASGEVIAQLPLAGLDDLERAARAADRAFRTWRFTDPAQRADTIRRAAALLRERRGRIARLMTLEQGKPLWESEGEVDFSADIVDFLAGEAERLYGEVIPSGAPNERTLLLPEPLGPVAAFTPWNYPLIVPARKMAAALAAGCTMVIKCAEETPASAVELARCFVDAGLPAGVLNLVFGVPDQVSTYLVRSPLIRKVSFTGSTPVGKHIAQMAAEGVKPVMLELGGHAPVLVFDDVDVEQVAQAAVGNKFHNAGQSCGSSSRFYVHERVHDDFVEAFGALTSAVTVGNGLDDGVRMGPLANSRRIAAIEALARDAQQQGARLVAGGERLRETGNFWAPTLLADVPDTARAMNEEPFGPLGVTQRFGSIDEVVAKANRLPYGLAAYVFTNDLRTATVVPRLLEVGMIGLNKFDVGGRSTFFGGVKESGYGSEGGPEAVRGYLTHKLILQA